MAELVASAFHKSTGWINPKTAKLVAKKPAMAINHKNPVRMENNLSLDPVLTNNQDCPSCVGHHLNQEGFVILTDSFPKLPMAWEPDINPWMISTIEKPNRNKRNSFLY